MPTGRDRRLQDREHEMIAIERRARNRHLVILDPTDPNHTRLPTSPAARFQQALRETCTSWFGMTVSLSVDIDVDHADIYVYCEPPLIELLRKRNRRADRRSANGEINRDQRGIPIIIVYMSNWDAVSMTRHQRNVLRELGRIVEVIPQPCGPRKLSKAFFHCLHRAEEARNQAEQFGRASADFLTIRRNEDVDQSNNLAMNERGTGATQQAHRKDPHDLDDLRRSVSAAVAYPTLVVLPASSENQDLQFFADQNTRQVLRQTNNDKLTQKVSRAGARLPINQQNPITHVLLVDDDLINRQLLVMFMKKCKFTYREAENGLEALEQYQNNPDRTCAGYPVDVADPYCSNSDLVHYSPNTDKAHKDAN